MTTLWQALFHYSQIIFTVFTPLQVLSVCSVVVKNPHDRGILKTEPQTLECYKVQSVHIKVQLITFLSKSSILLTSPRML